MLSGERTRDERGVGVVMALGVLLTVFVLAAVWSRLAIHQVEGSGRERAREQALAAAEAGLNRAMSRLAVDPFACAAPTWPMTGTVGTAGEYEVTLDTTVASCSDPTELRRYIVATGWAPSRTAPRAVARRLEHQVELVATDGFRYALFAAPGGLSGGQNLRVTGDIYSATNVVLSNQSWVFGNVVAQGTVTTGNSSTVGGYVHGGGAVTINDSRTTVQGDVLSGGALSVTGWVKGTAQAAGSISVTGSGRIDGTQAPSSPPGAPKVQALPTFTWNPLNYTPAPSTWASATAFKTYWTGTKSSFSGHHRITGASVGTLDLDSKWRLAGNTTIVSDGPIVLSRDIENASAGDVTLTIISLASGAEAIKMSNAVTLPASIRVLLFAPNGCIRFQELKNLTGAVYATCVTLDEHFTFTFAPLTVPGFSWDLASTSHFVIRARSFREVSV